MPTVNCASCGVKLDVPERKMGTGVTCPACKGEIFPQSVPVAEQAADVIEKTGESAESKGIEDPAQATASRTSDAKAPKEYKVIIREDAFTASRVNPEALAEALNMEAREGWTLKSCVAYDAPGLTENIKSLLLIMER